jgi:hypothetical protein
MEKKQSSIDWLVKELKEFYAEPCKYDKQEIIKQAKAMHKEEIIDARNNGFMQSAEGWNGEYGLSDFSCLTKEIQSEQYYNETFEK